MSQMVLPQNVPTGSSSEPGRASSASGAGNDKFGDGSFDSVSRSEQKRLEAKESADARETKSAEAKAQKSDADTDTAANSAGESPESDRQSPAEGKPGEKTGQEYVADGAADGKAPALEPDDSLTDSVPVTFAGLQSLMVASQSRGSTPAVLQGTGQGKGQAIGQGNGAMANGQALPLIQGSVMSMSGLNGAGKTGSLNLQTPGQTGSPAGVALAETLLAGVTAEGARAADSPMLQNAIRFQGAMESVSAQANAVNTPKMAPDAPILRGYTTSIDVPVSHAEWGDKMAGKLTWLTARNMSVAEIHLTPPDMGPMEVRVQVQQDQANISVHSANPVVREQLELHSHRLRDMLNAQGLSLEQFDVSDSGRDQTGNQTAKDQQGSGGASGSGLMADAELDDANAELQSLDLTWKGEVDIFA